MKKLTLVTGILLLILGILLYIVAGSIQENAKPQQVSYGTVINGQYNETGSGTIGGSSENYKFGSQLKTWGIIAGIAGGILTLCSAAMEGDRNDNIY